MDTNIKRDTSLGISRRVMEQAQEGNAKMQYQLASYLYVGDKNKAPDKEQGFRWMKASAENGCVKAQKILGLLYTNGQHAPWPEQDLEKAVLWYERAAEQGDSEAMYWLSCCYRKGVGVLYDDQKAQYWLEQAKIYGYVVDDEDEAPVSEEEPAPAEAKPWEQYDLEEESYSRHGSAEGKKRVKDRNVREKSLKQKSLDIAQEGVIFTPKHDIEYVKSAIVYGVIALSIGIIICCLAAVLINAYDATFFESSKRGAFLTISGLISIGLGVLAFRNGYLSAYEESKRCAWFRKTPFYRQYHVDFDRLSSREMMLYEYYTALEKSFKPCAHQDVIPRSAFREFRGYMFLGLYFGERGSSACPDFVVVTEKSVYVISCLMVEGKLRGAMDEREWFVTTESGRGRTLPNPILQNERRIRIMKKDLSHICPWAVTDVVPFYSMVVFGQDADLRSITGVRKEGHTHMLQMSGEELRGYIEVLESKNSLLEEETVELTKAMEQIAGEYDKRRAAFGKEVI